MENDSNHPPCNVAFIGQVIYLACAPFSGAAKRIRLELHRPANTWRQVAGNDVRLYFAPFVGAVEGIREAWRTRRHS
jgi:hypothetical protein